MSNVQRKIKTSTDYLSEYNKLHAELSSLKQELSERFLKLCKENPDIIIHNYFNTPIKAKNFNSKLHVDCLSFDEKIKYLNVIEDELLKKEKHVQGKLFN